LFDHLESRPASDIFLHVNTTWRTRVAAHLLFAENITSEQRGFGKTLQSAKFLVGHFT